MCSVSRPPLPKMAEPAPTPPALQAPAEASASREAASSDAKRRQAVAYGRGKTILTGSEGDTSPYRTEKKSLLGL